MLAGIALPTVFFELDGLIDHPSDNANLVCASEIMFQIGRGLLGRAVQVEGRDKLALTIHQIDQRGVIHGVIAILERDFSGIDPIDRKSTRLNSSHVSIS